MNRRAAGRQRVRPPRARTGGQHYYGPGPGLKEEEEDSAEEAFQVCLKQLIYSVTNQYFLSYQRHSDKATVLSAVMFLLQWPHGFASPASNPQYEYSSQPSTPHNRARSLMPAPAPRAYPTRRALSTTSALRQPTPVFRAPRECEGFQSVFTSSTFKTTWHGFRPPSQAPAPQHRQASQVGLPRVHQATASTSQIPTAPTPQASAAESECTEKNNSPEPEKNNSLEPSETININHFNYWFKHP